MNASDITCDWDEGGLYLTVPTDRFTYLFRVEDPEQLYDRVKAAILPWLMERDEALREYRLMGAAVEADMREAYEVSDPKHPDFHSVHADLWDSREGK